MNASSLDAAREAKGPAMELFGQLAEVVGVGITRIDDGYGLKVNLLAQPARDVSLPDQVNGVPVRVEVVGPIHKL